LHSHDSSTSGWATRAVDVLTDKESLELLAEWSGQTDLPPAASETARQCGNLPLALALAGACVREGLSWNDLVDALRSAELELPDHAHGSVMKSLKVSLDTLDREIARRYIELAVLPAGESVAEAGLITLWARSGGVSERDARKTVAALARKGLLRVEGDESNRCISIHPFLHDYLRRVNTDLQKTHSLMLEAYRGKCTNGWVSGPDDGYFFEHLLYHLAGAGFEQQVHGLFASGSPDVGLAWFDVHRRIGKLNLFIEDTRYGWRLAEGQSQGQLEHDQKAASVGVEVGYAIVRASINTFASALSPNQIASLVSRKKCSIEQGLAYAHQIPKRVDRLTALLAVASEVPEERRPAIVHAVIDEALEASVGSHVNENVIDLVIRLADLEFAKEALQLAPPDAHCLPNIGERLTQPLRTVVLLEALKAALAETIPSSKASRLSELVTHLPETARALAIREGLKAARAIGRDEFSDSGIDSVYWLAKFIPYFDGSAQSDLVAEMKAKLDAISVPEDRSRAIAASLAYLSPRLQLELLQEGLTLARSLSDPKARSWQLGSLLPYVDEGSWHGVLDEAINAALAIRKEDERATAIAHLAPLLPSKVASDLAAILANSDDRYSEWNRSWALSEIARRFATLGCPDEALSAARSIRDPDQRRNTFSSLTQILEDLPDLSEEMSPIHDEEHRAKAIVAFAGYLAADEMRYALQTIEELPWTSYCTQTQALVELAPRLPESLVPLSLDIAVSLPNNEARLTALAALAPRVDTVLLLDKAVFVARSFGLPQLKARALVTLASHLSDSLKVMVLDDAEHATRAVKRKPCRAEILSDLAALSPEPKKTALIREALADALRIDNEYQRARTLEKLGPNLPRDLVWSKYSCGATVVSE